ncbi:unnamed protein product [Dicrocoelium dendriticum]|nr:unnamed protein product [Dicrocoelium dendriticum]
MEPSSPAHKAILEERIAIGDLLAAAGSILYGISIVLQEYVSTHYGPSTYLALGGAAAAILNAIYCAGLEHTQLREIFQKGMSSEKVVPLHAIMCFTGFVASLFGLQVTTTYAITRFSAVFLSISSMTAAVYGLVIGVCLFHMPFHYLSAVALVFTVIGTILFTVYPLEYKETEQMAT